MWFQLNYNVRNTRTEGAELREKTLRAPLALCDKNLLHAIYGLRNT